MRFLLKHYLKISQIYISNIKEEPNIKLSSNDFTTLLKVILKNKQMTIDLLKDLTKLNIIDFEFDDLKNMRDLSGYDFPIVKLKAIIDSKGQEDNTVEEENSLEDYGKTDLYVKIIRKDRIKESIFCYWSLLYDEKFKDYEESEFTSVINKVRITETESKEYKHSVLLEIKENKWGILEYGSTIHLVKFAKYLNDKTINKSKLTNEWKKYLEEENQDVLFIGVIN